MLLDGKATAKKIKDSLKQKISSLPYKVGLAVIQVGDVAASSIYVRLKEKACKYVGIESTIYRMPESVSQKELLDKVYELNNTKDVYGVLVQLPLPKHIDERTVIESIDPVKDVDGFHPINVGKLSSGLECIEPCTPKGVMRLLNEYNIELSGKNAVVIGRSNIVGKPVSMMLLKENATVTVCHSKTQNMEEIVRKADVIVAAVGVPGLVKADMVKDGAVIVDVGINRVDGKVVGDVDFDAVKDKCSYITPVPGGIGPMTIAMLLENTVESAVKRN